MAKEFSATIFFHVAHDGRSERGTTGGLVLISGASDSHRMNRAIRLAINSLYSI